MYMYGYSATVCQDKECNRLAVDKASSVAIHLHQDVLPEGGDDVR